MISADGFAHSPNPQSGGNAKVEISGENLENIRVLFEQGQTRRAFDLARSFGPLQCWQGTRARVLAGRIAADLGAPRLAHALQIRAHRDNPTDPQARAFFAASILERRGPLEAWLALREFSDPSSDNATSGDAAEYLLSLRARVAAIWRDFETANRWLERAKQISPDSAWLAVEESFILEQEDRYEECLAAARRSLQLRPWYRPAVLATTHALQLLDRDEEALAILVESVRHIESVVVHLRLAALQNNLDRHAEAEETLQAICRFSPILEKDERDWLAVQRTLTAYRGGDFQKAVCLARVVSHSSVRKLAEKLAVPVPVLQRVRLPIAFVRQHHVTCSPATLAALSGFWRKPAEHLAIAEEICYDGTPAHSERNWAEQNGFLAREFTVTWDSAVALLERGIPFALHTVAVRGGHAQAVVGFDELRQTLLIRDPFHYFEVETEAEELFQRFRASGPRGMAMVPRERAELLDDLKLPDAEWYDQLHALHRALAAHRREVASALLERMQAAKPAHRLTLTAQRALAVYDANAPMQLESIDGLLTQYPDDGPLCLAKLGCLAELGRRQDRLAFLESICQRPDCDPVFWREYAAELSVDGRRDHEFRRWLRRSMRGRYADAAPMMLLAESWWREQRFDESLELLRSSACLTELQEAPALRYFSAARWCERTDEALRFLRQRVRRWGIKSFLPVATLFRAYAQLDELPQAFAVLDQQLRRCPEDGDLLLFAADVHVRFGKLPEAKDFLERAAPRVRRQQFLRVAAELAELRGEPAQALECLREILAHEPLALDAHQSTARLLAQTSGRAAVVAHLEAACERFPHHVGLRQLWIAWMHDQGARATERVLRQMAELHPDNGWVQRELALALAVQGRLSEALIKARQATHLEPAHPQSHYVRAQLFAQLGDDAAARESFQEALRLGIEDGAAIQRLLDCSHTPRERADVLAFVASELRRQPTFGNALLLFREVARLHWPAEQLVDYLRDQLRDRPTQWQTRAALVYQLTEMNQSDEALSLAREATERFPLILEPWLVLAFVQRVRFDPTGESATLKQLVRLYPHDSTAATRLADFHARTGDFAEAKAVAERACALNPLDPRSGMMLADILWRTGERDRAVEKTLYVLRLNSEDDWPWRMLSAWAADLGRAQLATTQARELVTRRKDEARPWLRLAFALANENQLAEALDAIEEALSRNPRLVEAYDAKAMLLCQLNRHDDALDACRADCWNGRVPVELQFRSAWTMAHRGNLPRAIAELRQLLERHSGFWAGWRDLADWCWRRGDESGALAAIAEMFRLAPLDPQAYCFRAEIRKKRRDREGAKEDFQHALKLDPTFAPAAAGLFDTQMTDDEIDAAAVTLKLLQQQIGGKLASECAARLEARRAKQESDNRALEHLRRTSRGGDEFKEAAARLRELCLDPTADPAALDAAFRKLENTGNYDEANQIIKEALANQRVNPEVGALWVRSKVARRQWGLSTRLDELMKTNAGAGRRAVMAYARALGVNKRKKSLRYLLKDHGEWLRSEPEGWACVGLALSATGESRRFLEWMAEWREQPSAGQDVFAVYVQALRTKGRDRTATEVARAALSRPRQGDAAFYQLTLWCGIEAALAGNTREARAALREVVPETMSMAFRRIHRLTRSVIEVQSAPHADLAVAQKSALKRVQLAYADLRFFRAGRAARRIFRRGLRRMSIDGRNPKPVLWSYWRLYGFCVLVVLTLPGIALLLTFVPWLFLPLVAGVYVGWKRRCEQMSNE